MPQPRSAVSPRAATSEISSSWLRRFWVVIIATLLLASASIFLVTRKDESHSQEIVHVPLRVQATGAGGLPIVGKLALLIERPKEDDLRRWEQKLQHVASSEISELFDQGRSADLAQVRTVLLKAFNQALPKPLQLRDLLIEDFFRVTR